jgi:hypothetical protein
MAWRPKGRISKNEIKQAFGNRYDYIRRNVEAQEIFAGECRPCLKHVKTPKRRIFFRHATLNFLAGRWPACEKLP